MTSCELNTDKRNISVDNQRRRIDCFRLGLRNKLPDSSYYIRRVRAADAYFDVLLSGKSSILELEAW